VILHPLGSIAAREDGSYCQVVGLCCHAISDLCSVETSVDRRNTQNYLSNPFRHYPDYHETSVCHFLTCFGVIFVFCSECVETKKAERPT